LVARLVLDRSRQADRTVDLGEVKVRPFMLGYGYHYVIDGLVYRIF
jgi:hypothetical protein